jgi:hypothetical protein
MKKITLLSGIPASGKSTYGKWLESEKGFIYWDLEHETLEEVAVRAGLYLGTGSNLESLLHATESIPRTVVIDWGFPPDTCLDTVRWLLAHGVDIWWFDGDHAAARISFLKRSPELEDPLNIQMEKIERFYDEIKRLFGDHQIYSVVGGPKYLPLEDIYEKMSPASENITLSK